MAKQSNEAASGAEVSVYGYGSSEILANLLDSTAAFVDREPAQSFVDEEAHTAAVHLSRLLVIRMQEAEREQSADERAPSGGARGRRPPRGAAWPEGDVR
jgi:hypothetical protein